MKHRGCVFARMGYRDCDGPLDPSHWCPKQRIKAVLKGRGYPAEQIAAIVWDPRVTAPACRAHHSAFDNKAIRLREDDYPVRFRAWAAEHDFEFRGPRDGWVGIHVEDDGPAAA